MAYIPLPAARVPRNAMLDFSGFSDAAEIYAKGRERNAMLEYQRGRDAKADARADEDQRMQREQFGMQKQQYTDQRHDKLVARLAGLAQMVDEDQNPTSRQQRWGQIISSSPAIGENLRKYGIDPNDHVNGPKFIIAEARGYQNPLETRKAEAEIANTQAQTGYYNAQAGHKDVAGRYKEVDKRLVRINDDGTATEVYRPSTGVNDPNVVRNLSAGLDRLRMVPTDMGKYAFEAATGPLQGSPDGYFLAPLARAWGSVINAAGSHSTTEVRNRINGDALALAAAIKPLVRKPGEGTWTDKDQELLNSIVGNLAQANNLQEYYAGIEAVRERIKANFGIDLPPPNAGPRSQEQAPQLAPGTIEDGYRFKGGNPADRNSWERVR